MMPHLEHVGAQHVGWVVREQPRFLARFRVAGEEQAMRTIAHLHDNGRFVRIDLLCSPRGVRREDGECDAVDDGGLAGGDA